MEGEIKYMDNGEDCAGILCKSVRHADHINAVLTKRALTVNELCGYLVWMCGNCANGIDSLGRNALHIAAARGLKGVVEWLLNCKHAQIDSKDRESGYTPLHRSIFYGQIHVAVYLIKNGANFQSLDHEHLTALDHAMKDRLERIHYSLNNNCEVYMWGTNSNYTLGLQHTKPYPELLSKQNLDVPIKQVCLRKFHCVMVGKDGRVYSCGHGQGGRLGLGETNTAMIPTQVHFQTSASNQRAQSTVCKEAAIGYDHSIFLMDSSMIWACGLNTYHVLGFNPPPEMLLTPKPLPEFKTTLQGICAGRFHSVAWCSTAVYTWGFNAGQLGHESILGHTVITPKQVTSLRGTNFQITDVAASDGATVVVVQRGDIYVLHEYQCRKIASRQLNVAKVSVIGGHLNEKLDKNLLKESNPLKVLVLTNRGDILLWQESSLQLTRCIFSINRALIVRDAVLNKTNILFVTADGEAFQGQIKDRKIKPVIENANQKSAQKKTSQFHKFLDKHECELIVVNRLRNVHRAVAISSDSKGRNFSVLQNDPKIYLLNKLPQIESSMHQDMYNLLHDTNDMDLIHDLIFKIDSRTYRAHQFIVASNSKILATKIQLASSKLIEIENIHPDIFAELLEFMYTKSCSILEKEYGDDEDRKKSAYEFYSKKADIKNPLRMLQSAAKQLGVLELYQYISAITQSKKSCLNELKFDRSQFPDMYDVKVKCNNNQTIPAHRCILAGRLDYFNNLFAMRWNEDSKRTVIGLPFPPKIVQTVIDFLYTDSMDIFTLDSDMDQVCNVLVVADQLLMQRLKEVCELTLLKKISLRNVALLIQFADIYNCKILKSYTMEFICINLSSILENRTLEILDDSILEEISSHYWNNNKKLHARMITPYSDAPKDDLVKSVCSLRSFNMEDVDEDIDKQLLKLNHKKKLCRQRKTTQSKTHNDSVCSNISENDFPSSATEVEIFSLENLQETEHTTKEWITVNSPHQKLVQARLKANAQVKEELDYPQPDKFTKLISNSPPAFESPFGSPLNDFPELNSPRIKENYIEFALAKSPPSAKKIQKLSQKQRKKMSLDQSNLANHLGLLNLSNQSEGLSSTSASTPKQNPWKKIDFVADITQQSPEQPVNFPDIIACEQKKRENLTRMTAKPLLLTQIEDRAIQEIKRFYNADYVFEEYLTVQRVEQTNIAAPRWVTGRK